MNESFTSLVFVALKILKFELNDDVPFFLIFEVSSD
jgi:hypothetical protein